MNGVALEALDGWIPHLWQCKGFYWNNPDIFWTMVGIRKVF